MNSNTVHICRADIAVGLNLSTKQIEYSEDTWGLTECRVKTKNRSVIYRLKDVRMVLHGLGFDISNLPKA